MSHPSCGSTSFHKLLASKYQIMDPSIHPSIQKICRSKKKTCFFAPKISQRTLHHHGRRDQRGEGYAHMLPLQRYEIGAQQSLNQKIKAHFYQNPVNNLFIRYSKSINYSFLFLSGVLFFPFFQQQENTVPFVSFENQPNSPPIPPKLFHSSQGSKGPRSSSILQLQNLKLQLEKRRNFLIQPSQTCGVGIWRFWEGFLKGTLSHDSRWCEC